MKLGAFLIHRNVLSQERLEQALSLQHDNPAVLLGDVLVTQGVLTKQALLGEVEAYIRETGLVPPKGNEWLTQAEIDELIVRLRAEDAP